MRLWSLKELPELPKMRLGVVGHVEWVSFLKVEEMPKAGIITHGDLVHEEPAGGGAVAAIQMAKITGEKITLMTALGKDEIGEKCYSRLKQYGLDVKVNWVEMPTRRGISMVAPAGERAITIIGERIEPKRCGEINWSQIKEYDGVFITASDTEVLKSCKEAKVIVATPRLGIERINESNIKLDAIIGSKLDPAERFTCEDLANQPRISIKTEGALGGEVDPGGRFQAIELEEKEIIDTYGCGDTFAAGVTIGLAAGWTTEQAISLGCYYGAKTATHSGPYGRI